MRSARVRPSAVFGRCSGQTDPGGDILLANSEDAVSEPLLSQKLEAHATWLRSLGVRGVRLDLSRCGIMFARLRGADLVGACLQRADLRQSDLSDVNFSGADLRGTDLRFAELARADFSVAILKGVKFRGANLNGANLRRAQLWQADPQYASVRGVSLAGAELMGAQLGGVDLTETKLCGADLGGADLRKANLCGTDFRRANLRGASLEGAIVDHDTNFAGTKADPTVFSGVDLDFLRAAYLPPCLRTTRAL